MSSAAPVARGIRRLLFLWQRNENLKGLRLAIFLHGEENLERFRRETSCAVHYLPWLAPELNDSTLSENSETNNPQISVESPRHKMVIPQVSELLHDTELKRTKVSGGTVH